MSALTEPVRIKMFEFLKNIFRKPSETATDCEEPFEPAVETEEITPAPAVHYSQSMRVGSHQNGRGLEIPLQAILQALPLELQPRVKQPDVGPLTISVPLEKILAQLSSGVVKVSFGELRQAAPSVFTSGNDRDRVAVALPLGEIIARLNPALITRRRTQKHV